MVDEDDQKRVGFLDVSPSSTDYGSMHGSANSEEDPDVLNRSISSTGSRRSSLALVKSENVWTSVRRVADRFDFDMVPTQRVANVKFVTDPNLDVDEKGRLYYAEECFYNKEEDPQYGKLVKIVGL